MPRGLAVLHMAVAEPRNGLAPRIQMPFCLQLPEGDTGTGSQGRVRLASGQSADRCSSMERGQPAGRRPQLCPVAASLSAPVITGSAAGWVP